MRTNLKTPTSCCLFFSSSHTIKCPAGWRSSGLTSPIQTQGNSPPMRHPITPVLGDIRLPKLGLGKTQPGGYPMAGFDTEKCCTWSSKLIHPDEVYVSIYYISLKTNPHPTFRYAQPKIFEPPLRPHVSRWLKWNHTYHTFLLVKIIFHKRSSIPSFKHFQSLSLKSESSAQ